MKPEQSRYNFFDHRRQPVSASDMQQFMARDPTLRFRIQRYERRGKQHDRTEETESHRTYAALRHTEERIRLCAQASLFYRTRDTIERRRHTFMAVDDPQSTSSPTQPGQKNPQKKPTHDPPPRDHVIKRPPRHRGDDNRSISFLPAARN